MAGQPSEVERIKERSDFLRGSIRQGLADQLTGAVHADDTQLLKFHGTYQQDDRDVRDERRRAKLEPAYAFMIRVRAAGGVLEPRQWLALDGIAERYAGGTLRLTSRQSLQLHGVVKWELQQTIAAINSALLTTLAACGDVNRNVMCHPNPHTSAVHGQVHAQARALSEHLLPHTTAYHEIWLEGEKVLDSRGDAEPLYGPTYMPRKFKIGVAIPPSNDVDVFTQDLGLIAVADGDRLVGFDVAVGGGMGMTYGEPRTYPNLAQVIGFCTPEQLVAVAEGVLTIQRDHGDRTDRKHARLKYTIDDRGLDWFMAELERRQGFALAPARPYAFESTGDRFGWVEGSDGLHHLTLFVENGRLAGRQMTALRAIAEDHAGDFRLTPNQNVMVCGVPATERARVERVAAEGGLLATRGPSPLRRAAMACVALPTCGLAMAESERYLPHLLERLEGLLAETGLAGEEIVVRMSGCPNGCSRPYLGEIGLTGKAPGRYNLYLGAGFRGDRLNCLYRENIDEAEILGSLRPILEHYAHERTRGEHFGDFVVRAGYVRAVRAGREFHQAAEGERGAP
jgi:sulfite reductase (NADPH) hemoprotein beta-component